MDKELKILVERLDRIFPELDITTEGHYVKDEKCFTTDDYAPPSKLDWYDFIRILKNNGLEIRNKKE